MAAASLGLCLAFSASKRPTAAENVFGSILAISSSQRSCMTSLGSGVPTLTGLSGTAGLLSTRFHLFVVETLGSVRVTGGNGSLEAIAKPDPEFLFIIPKQGLQVSVCNINVSTFQILLYA